MDRSRRCGAVRWGLPGGARVGLYDARVSMNGEYLRVTAAELRHAIEDPQWALDHADQVRDAVDLADQAGDEWDGLDPQQARQRYLTTHKAWDAIGYLLRRNGFPVDISSGVHAFTDDDWGYGPAHYLTAQEVADAATALAATPFDALVAGVTAAGLAEAEVYPMMWDEPDALDWIRHWYEPLAGFFAAAADAGDSILVWLS